MAPCSSWSNLPRELIDRIFRRPMDSKDLARCTLVCTNWRNIIVDIWGKKLSLLRPAFKNPSRRILREYEKFQMDPPKGCKARLVENLFHWGAIMIGPQNSLYAGGVFLLNIHFSKKYPFEPPEITFQTKVYHPNIGQDGCLCLERSWCAAMSISNIIRVIYALFSNPDHEDPLDFEIAHIYRTQRIRYEQKARAWTKKYATARQNSAIDWSQFLMDHKILEPQE
ncbi:hypothetical protein ACB098_06G030100 [Castanea mollissima]